MKLAKKGKNYPCEQWGYEATLKINLTIHLKSFHMQGSIGDGTGRERKSKQKIEGEKLN